MQCEDTSRRIPGRFGFLRQQCARRIALTKWRDETGRDHVACAAHFPALERRYPMVEPTWLHELFRVVEHDNMTGAERDLDNYANDPWSKTFTREEAEGSVEWRKTHIDNRYSYRIVPIEDPDYADPISLAKAEVDREESWTLA